MIMEYEERIDRIQGNYIVADCRYFENVLDKKPLIIDGLTVNIGEKTTLYDWFTKPCLFVGFLKEAAIFYLGQNDSTLFDSGAFYYDATYIIASDRILKIYKLGSARDFFLNNKNGKIYWK